MRGHRLNIFSDRFKYVGLAVGPHKKFKYCCVVNFAVEYTEKQTKKQQEDQEEEVFETQLPMLRGQDYDDEDEIYPEERDEMIEWKGPGGFPYKLGGAGNNNRGANGNQQPGGGMGAPFGFNRKKVEVKASLPPSGNPIMAFNKKKKSQKSTNGKTIPLTMKKSPNANQKKPKCKLISIPIGKPSDDEDEVFEEVVEIKRKATIEDYNSDKEITAGNYACPIDNNDDTEENEEFRGGGFNFQKKKKQSNNMYMKRGANRNDYLKSNHPREKTLSRDKPTEMKMGMNRRMANTSPTPGRTAQDKHKPYTIPKKNAPYKVSKSPNRKNQYKKYTAPNQLNMKGELIRNQAIDNVQKWDENLIKDQRAKQLMKMDDFTIPHKAINCMTKRIIRTQGNQRIKTVRKIFTMRDGTQEIHENVFVERIDESK